MGEFYEDSDTTKIPISAVLGTCLVVYGGTVFCLNKFLDAGFNTIIFEIIVVVGCLILCVPFGLYIYSRQLSNTEIVSLGIEDNIGQAVRNESEPQEHDARNEENFQNNDQIRA